MVIKKNIQKVVYSAQSLLLSLVIVFNLSYNALHTHPEAKHHNEQHCSADEEQDACHRFIIHHEKSSECNGSHQHLSVKTKPCFICNFFKQQHAVNPSPVICSSSPSDSPSVVTNAVELHLSFLSFVFLRGPPSLC